MADWSAYPQTEFVHWPPDEKIIGVLGVNPMATADFYMRLCARPVVKEWEYPRIVIDSNPKIPSRGRCLDLGETDPVPFIKKGICGLVEQGADIIALPCNTAHIFYEKYAKDAPVEMPNIIEITARAAHGLKTLVLSTANIASSGLYTKALACNDGEAVYPDADGLKVVRSAIEAVKQKGYDQLAAGNLKELIGTYRVDCVILGCTELSVLFQREKDTDFWNRLGIKPVDSSQELADYCLDRALGKRE